jgi:photosystem II stability/assembly factor-like uncharacterized protein
MFSLPRRPWRRLLTFAALSAALLLLPLVVPSAHPARAGGAVKNGQSDLTLPAEWVKTLNWRCIGPANMGGRITAISVYEADPSIYYVATASGGLLKTVNNGTTFEHQFDHQATVSIGDVCVAPSNPNIVWVGTGENNPRNSVSYGDGVYKSTDGGKTWKNMGLKETFQIGKIVIHPKNPDIVYVGALGRLYGPNAQRGLFKTTDGGLSWDKIFFVDDKTGVIDIAMNPAAPDELLVAMWERHRDGHDSFLGKSAPEGYDTYDPDVRWGKGAGIYRTSDGGKTFNRVTQGLPTSRFGRVSLDYYRKDPRVVFAVVDCEDIGKGPPPKVVASNAFLGAFGEDGEPGARLNNVLAGGPADKAGLEAGDVIQKFGTTDIKTYPDLTDAVETHKPGDKVKVLALRDREKREFQVTLVELPKGGFGGKGGKGGGGFGGPGGAKPGRPYHAYYGGQKENKQKDQGPEGFQYGGVYKSTDGGESWTRVNSLNPRPMYFSHIRVDPSDDKYVYVLGVQQFRSSNGGKTFRGDAGKGVHADGHALWINPRNGKHMLIGVDGGLYVTYDRAKNWDHLNHMALGQFYHVALCNKKPYWVYGGLQDNGSWGGPSRGLRSAGGTATIGPINEDWVGVGGGDGFVCRVDPDDPDLVYYESQNGVMFRRNLRTGERGVIGTGGKGKGGKGFKGFGKGEEPGEKGKEPPGGKEEKPAEKGKGKGKGEPAHRFNWNTPFILSHHNPRVFYAAGEVVFRSVKRGDDLRVISPEVTLTKRGSATALAESPKNPDVLWVGTDDGGLWVTRDGGKKWTNLTAKVGLPAPRWVATIEPSRFVEGRAYVAFDAHRSDDDRPFIYVTEDFGETWRSLVGNLPPFGSTRCLREDVINKDLLYLGTEFSVYVSLNRGDSWTKINNNLPTVAVHEIAVHPTAGEIVAATHGRSIWILDVSALRQIKSEVVQERAHFFKPQPAVEWRELPAVGRTNRRFVGTNPAPGAQLYYSLATPADKVSLRIYDIDGKQVRDLKGSTKAGLHRVAWDLGRTAAKGKGGKGGFGGKGGKGGKGGMGQGAPFVFGPRIAVPPGDYRIVLDVDGRELTQSIRVEADPNGPRPPVAADEDEEEEEEEMARPIYR